MQNYSLFHIALAAMISGLIGAGTSGKFNGDEGYKRGRSQGFNDAVALVNNGIAGVTYPVGPEIHCDFTKPGKPRCS